MRRAVTTIVLVLVALLVLQGSTRDRSRRVSGDNVIIVPTPPGIPPTAVDGFDYWLPEWVEQYEYARLVATGSDLMDNIGDLEGTWAAAHRPRWKWYHVAEGTFDWSQLDGVMANALATGSDVQLNLFSGEWDYVPDWVKAKHGLTWADRVQIDTRYYAPIWLPGIREDFEVFIAALGARYAASPQLSSCYVHGISSSQGEELFFQSQDAANNAWDEGLTPEVMVEWLGDRLDAFAAAFAGHEYKLMWVGEVESNRYIHRQDADEGAMSWSGAASVLAHKAWALDMGHRGGNVERVWNKAGWAAMQDTSWAQHANVGPSDEWDHRHGYLEVNESIWPLADQKISIGEENEEFGNVAHWIDRFGPLSHHPIRYELSMMRALQLRLNHLWVYGEGVAMNPPLTEYVRLSMGRLSSDSADAFSRLCSAPSSSWYIGGSSVPGIDGELGLHYMRNIERFLYQRDVPAGAGVLGGITVPADRVDRTYSALNLSSGFDISDYYYDNLGVSTDVATGNPCIYFRVDDSWEIDGPVQLKVTYRNMAKTGAWWVEYTNELGAQLQTHLILPTGDTSIRTITFVLPSVAFSGQFGDAAGMDFRIVASGHDVSVRMVRLIRWLDGPPAPPTGQ